MASAKFFGTECLALQTLMREVKFTSILNYELLEERKNQDRTVGLILAQIERWRHAFYASRTVTGLRMLTSGEQVSNTSERARVVGITSEKLANTA